MIEAEQRIRQESGNINHQGLDISRAYDAYRNYFFEGEDLQASAEAMTVGIQEAMASGKLTDAEITSLDGVLAELVGDVDSVQGVGDNEIKSAGIGGSEGISYNFKDVRNLDDLRSRIPSNAQELPWRNIEGGATEGVKYRWTDEFGSAWNVRAHSIDPNAPLGSNASLGWVYRIEVRWSGAGKRYFMDSSGLFHSANELNPNSPLYNEAIANDTHIVLGKN